MPESQPTLPQRIDAFADRAPEGVQGVLDFVSAAIVLAQIVATEVAADVRALLKK